MQTVDEWDILPTSAESTLRNIMTANGITIQPAILAAAPAIESAKSEVQTVAQPASASPSTIQTPYIWAILIATIMALAAGGLVLRRRSTGQRSA
jgi:hypothetical protein